MKRSGPDSLDSWLISGACCFINIMLYGMARLSGVLFVASISWFNVNRESASFPYTFSIFVRNTSGPLVGYLGHKFGVRSVTTFGCILGAVGAGLCFFAESISIVTLLWGAVFGLGFGLGNILLPVSINQHFNKHRATASGISFSGACLGSFILPPVVEILLKTYGLSGTFLFLSGFILNCIPAALLLKKPNFEIKPPQSCHPESCEKQSITSGMKVRLYTVDNDSQISHAASKANTDIEPKVEEKVIQGGNSRLTYEERIKRLSTQTLLSNYSIRMSTTEPLDVEHIIENSKGRRTVDPKVIDAETLSLSSHNTTNSEKDDVFENYFRSSSVQYEKPSVAFSRNRAASFEHLVLYNGKDSLRSNYKESNQNYGYQNDTDEVNLKTGSDKSSNSYAKNVDLQSLGNKEIYYNRAYENNPDNYKCPSEQFQSTSDRAKYYQKSLEWTDTSNVKTKSEVLCIIPEKHSPKSDGKSSLGAFSIVFDPMFILIAITNAIYCFTFVCMITIIVDFARDLQIGTANEKYVLMTLSVGDLAGRLGLGWITDGDYMTTTAFASLCFACQGIITSAVVWSDGFATLIILVALYGFSEAGLIVIFPVIIAQYIDPDKQTVAIPSSNFLTGPLCLSIAPLIGYFRDETGSYDYVFYGIGILSAACCIAWMLAPYVARRQRRH